MRTTMVMFMAMFACDGTSTSTFDNGDGVDASLVDAPVHSGK